MLDDLKRALARVQSDYAFYVDCQTNPALALAGYDLSADERSALTDPKKLADVLLNGGLGISRLGITVTIKGRHDWVNRSPRPKPKPPNPTMEQADDGAKGEFFGRQIAGAEGGAQVEAIKRASTSDARTGATLRLMELLG